MNKILETRYADVATRATFQPSNPEVSGNQFRPYIFGCSRESLRPRITEPSDLELRGYFAKRA